MTRTNLVDAYDNRSVVAKLVSMEERISGAEDSIEKTVKDGQTSIDSKVDTGVTKINSLLTGLDDTIAKAEAAAATAETASTKAETAAKSVDEDIVAANNAVIDAKAYATTGILHDGTVVTSADNIAKSCETYADTAGKAATSASTSATDAAASQTAAGQMAASAETSAKEASGYLDTVKASADAAATSETNAAASEAKAQAIADSMDVSNMVTMTDEQTITGLKQMTNISNVFKARSRSSSAASNDVINFFDINSVNGKYNNLVHRTGATEDVPGCKHMDITCRSGPSEINIVNSTSPSGYIITTLATSGLTCYVTLELLTSYGPVTVSIELVQPVTYNKYVVTGYKVIDNGLISDSDVTLTIQIANYYDTGYHTYKLFVGITSELSRGSWQFKQMWANYVSNNIHYTVPMSINLATPSTDLTTYGLVSIDVPATVITYEVA